MAAATRALWACRNCMVGLCRWCRGARGRRGRHSKGSKREPTPVILHIYDMGDDEVARSVNEVFRPVGLGAFHGAVEVYGREWSFGHTEEGSGVFSCEPQGCPEHTYRESIPMGETLLSRREVRDLLKQLEWPGLEYDLLRQNCCHWCDEFCKRLGVGPIPAWVNQLAGEVASLDDGIKKIDDGVRKAAANARAVIEEARSKTVELNNQIHHHFEAKTDEIKENVQATASLVRDTLEAKTEEIRDNLEATARDFMTQAEEWDQKLKSSMTAAAEDIARETQQLFRHREGKGDGAAAAVSHSTTAPAAPQTENRLWEFINGFGSSEEPAWSPPQPSGSRQKSD